MKHKKKLIFGIILLIIVAISIIDYSYLSVMLNFFSEQILGMKWLNEGVYYIIESIGGTTFAESTIGSSIHFFIYDFIKICLLLCFLIFGISYIQSYFPPERTRLILSKYKGVKANIIGALLGTVTPFCSCSSIPIFMGFTRAGLSSGITFSFLISSPLVDLASLLLLVSCFGWTIAIWYIIVGLILAVIGGTIIEKTKLGLSIEDFVLENMNTDLEYEDTQTTKDRLTYSYEQMITTFKKVYIYIIIGVGIGSLIHNVIPEEIITALLGSEKWYSVLVATVVGIPMYADIFGTLPIAEALYAKGVGIGTILAFMMSVTALSLPSLIMLRKVVKPKLLAAFIIIVVIGIIIIGYTFNAFYI